MLQICRFRQILLGFAMLLGVVSETTVFTTTEEPHCITLTLKPPTLYEYYSRPLGFNEPLNITGEDFHLNGKKLVIYSGSFHYFRTLPERWDELLKKYRAAGLNTVQIYVPWNLHEDTPDSFDFVSPALNLDRVLTLIKQNDMFAIVRPGPYICAEWEWGGLPSWLLRDPTLKIRTLHKFFMERTKKYYERVLSIVNKHQWSVSNGPVILFQLENEYFGAPGDLVHDLGYLRQLRAIVRTSGYKEALFTSDPLGVWIFHDLKSVFPEEDVLETANFNSKSAEYLKSLRLKQPNRPLFVTEFWSGWFDQWNEKHHKVASDFFERELRDIVFTSSSSVNFYMFFGGTNFGFMNGARVTTSYDYDAPLSEDGNYTEKYEIVLKVYLELVRQGRMPYLALPEKPILRKSKAEIENSRTEVEFTKYVPFEVLLNHSSKVISNKILTMEQLDLGENYGQRYGFILYRIRKTFSAHVIELHGQFHDRAIFLRDGILFSEIPSNFPSVNIKPKYPSNESIVIYDFFVENQGRQNHALKMDQERKGLNPAGNITLDGHVVDKYEIYALDFNRTFMQTINSLTELKDIPEKVPNYFGPALYVVEVNFKNVEDFWIELPEWNKGQIFINDFNLGRYWNKLGPQTRFYVPRELIKFGTNKISIFETLYPGKHLKFHF